MRDALNQKLQELERQNQAQMWDLKEKLDYANTQKQSLRNYVDYVQDSYSQAFETGRAAQGFEGDDDDDDDDARR